MSQMSTIPVFACRVCKRPVSVSHLVTYENDPDGTKLTRLMKSIADIALCSECQNIRDYYARQNRANEFLTNQLNPHKVLYRVDGDRVGWYASTAREAENEPDQS